MSLLKHHDVWLALETSTPSASLALDVQGARYETVIEGVGLHAQRILPEIQSMLMLAGCKIQDINAIVFGCGPGSFTGLRVACSVAKGLAFARQLPLYPVNSLLNIASQHFQTQGENVPVLTMIDARMQQWYWAYYPDASQLLSIMPQVTGIDKMISTVTQDVPMHCTGTGLALYESLCKHHAHYEHRDPSAGHALNIVQKYGIEPTTAQEALPVYIRDQVTHGG